MNKSQKSKKKLVLNAEKYRILTSSHLRDVVGGYPLTKSCGGTCSCSCTYCCY
jgi:hypothetical protein